MTCRVLFTVTARVTLVAALLLSFKGSFAQDSLKNKAANLPGNPRVNPTESELTQSRADVIQKMKETRAGAEKLLALHETERRRLAEECERHRDLYYQGLIARKDMLDARNVRILRKGIGKLLGQTATQRVTRRMNLPGLLV